MTARVERTDLAPGFSISRVLTGLWQIADMEKDGEPVEVEATARAMEPYVEAGLTTFDMADHYGSAEEVAGFFRDRLVSDRPVELLTKWVPDPGAVTRTDVRAAVERSLERLRSRSLDLLQLHAWRYADPAWLDCLFRLQDLKAEGLIRHLGVTNFDAPHLRMALTSGIELVSNQVCYSLLDDRPRGAMEALCLEHGVGMLAYGTVAGGFLTEGWVGRPEPEMDDLGSWSRMKYKRFIDHAGGWDAFQRLLEGVGEVAEKHGVSMANVACRAILDRPAVAGVIVGARLGRSRHLEDNLRVFDLELDDEDRARLEEARSGLEPLPGGCGDEYRRPPYLTAAGDLSDHFDEFPPPYPVEYGDDGRARVVTGTVWEDAAGFSRAVRDGDTVRISGTTAHHRDRAIGGSDAVSQAHFVLDKVQGALESLGAGLEDVVRTRIYVAEGVDWEAVARVHGERLGPAAPANTMVRAGLIGDGALLEIEADARVPPGRIPGTGSTSGEESGRG